MTQNTNKNQIISLITICGTILLTWFFIMNMDFYITNTSNNGLPNNMTSNTISIQGDWEVFATPDMLILNLTAEERRSTTAEAQAEVNKKTNQIKDIIKKYKIKDSDIQTKNISVYPEYDYSSKERTLKWYRARHSLTVTIKNADFENDWIGWNIIDDVSQIWGIQVNNINYDIEDKTPYYTQARKLAMKKAKQKAWELAEVAWMKLTKPISISENLNTYYPPMPMYKNTYSMDMVKEDSMWWWSDISLWELTIKINVNVVYWIE